MRLALVLISGLCWTFVYFEAARLGFRDKTYAIPFVALALNLAWETVYAAHGLLRGFSPQTGVNIVWAVADILVLTTYFRYGKSELPAWVSRPMFWLWTSFMMLAAYTLQLLFIFEFGARDGGGYAAFLQNLLMSGLFIAMLVRRGSTRGQSLPIATAKCLGTLAPTLLFGVVHEIPFYLGVGVLCTVLDTAYIWLLYKAQRQPSFLAACRRPLS